MSNGKQNKHGRLEYAAAIRNKDVLRCSLGALAFYFFWRWQIDGEAFPAFETRRKWYDIRVLKGKDREADISYGQQLSWTNHLFLESGISSSKKTHAGRGAGARSAEEKGVSDMMIRRAGRWNNDQMNGCYTTSLPRDAMRGLAGFPLAAGSFYLPRAQVMPSIALQQMIFPATDSWCHQFATGKVEQMDMAGQGFLQLLCDLRIILLQDSILLRQSFPEHPLWQHPVFSSEEYNQFERLATDSDPEIEPEELLLQRTVPLIAERLQMANSNIVQELRLGFTEQQTSLTHLKTRIGDFFEGRIPFVLMPQGQKLQQRYSRPINRA
jgi:Centromere DNA-binding protein complex CBF3 subunit, domain 2